MKCKIRILGHKYSVTYDQDKLDAQENRGECDPLGNEIVIDEVMPVSSQMETLWHEILEAVNFRLEIGLEHKQISSIAAALFAVMSDNRSTLTKLWDREDGEVG